MIGYVCVGTNNLQKAAAYYDTLLAELGGKRFMELGGFIAWGSKPNQPLMAVTEPYDKQPATVGNGVMVAFACEKPADVDRVYKKAMELGSKDEGPAGARSDTFYAGYFRDPEGNKLCAFCITPKDE